MAQRSQNTAQYSSTVIECTLSCAVNDVLVPVPNSTDLKVTWLHPIFIFCCIQKKHIIPYFIGFGYNYSIICPPSGGGSLSQDDFYLKYTLNCQFEYLIQTHYLLSHLLSCLKCSGFRSMVVLPLHHEVFKDT